MSASERDEQAFEVFSDKELLQYFAAGKADALNELFRRHWPMAYTVACRLLGNAADAQDAVQEGYVTAISHLNKFQGRSSFKTWLLRVVYNEALDLGRKVRRRASGRPRAAEEEYARSQRDAEQRTPLDEVIEQEDEDRARSLDNMIRRILKKQPAMSRMLRILKLRLAGRTFAQIAEEQKVCEKTARLDIDRVRDIVHRELAARGNSVR